MGTTGNKYKLIQNVVSGLECHKLCKNHAECMVAIYVTTEHGWTGGHKYCYLKWGGDLTFGPKTTGIESSMRDCTLPPPPGMYLYCISSPYKLELASNS